MKLVLQIVLAAFMVLYFCGVIGAKQERERGFYLAAALLIAVALIVTIGRCMCLISSFRFAQNTHRDSSTSVEKVWQRNILEIQR